MLNENDGNLLLNVKGLSTFLFKVKEMQILVSMEDGHRPSQQERHDGHLFRFEEEGGNFHHFEEEGPSPSLKGGGGSLLIT